MLLPRDSYYPVDLRISTGPNNNNSIGFHIDLSCPIASANTIYLSNAREFIKVNSQVKYHYYIFTLVGRLSVRNV